MNARKARAQRRIGETHRLLAETDGANPPGESALMLLPPIPVFASKALSDALTVRNHASITGQCGACDARRTFMGVDHRDIAHAEMRHDEDCPATDENIGPLLRAHRDAGLPFEPDALDAYSVRYGDEGQVVSVERLVRFSA